MLPIDVRNEVVSLDWNLLIDFFFYIWCIEMTCFFGPDGSGRCAGVTGADGVTGHHSELVLHPGVELHGHGRLHVSCHGVRVCTQNEGSGRYWGCGSAP